MTQNATPGLGVQYSQPAGGVSASYASGTGTEYPAPTPKKRSIWPFALLGVIVGLIILMFVTCPSESSHRKEVQQLGEKAVKMLAAEQNNALVTGISYLLGGKVVEMFVNECLTVSNYGVVSVGRINDPTSTTEPVIVSVGVLGHVYTASPEVVADKMKSTINKAQQLLGTEITNGVKEGINGIANGVTEGVNDVVNDVKQSVNDALDGAVDDARSRIEEEIDNFLSSGDDE